MADIKPFAGMSQEETNQTMLYLLATIAEKLPRSDNFDRMVVTHAESNPTVAIAASQTLATVTTVATVTTCADVTRVNNIGSASGMNTGNMIPLNMSNMSATLLYNQIQVT